MLSPGSWDSGALNLKTRVPLGPGLEPSLRLPPLRAPRHPYFGTPASAYQPSRLVLHSLFLCSLPWMFRPTSWKTTSPSVSSREPLPPPCLRPLRVRLLLPFSQWPGLSSALVSCSLRAAVILFSLGAACFSCMACASHGLPPSVPALPVSVLALAVLRGWGSVGDFSVWHTQRAGASGWPVLLCRRRTTLLCELRSTVLWRCG